MRGTRPAGESQYGAANTLHPGRRNKTQKFDTSIRNTQLTLSANPTIAAARAAVATAVVASRAVLRRTIGLARSVPSGGQVLTLVVTTGGTGYSFTSPTANTAATGGNGTGLTINVTRTSGVVTAVAVGSNAGSGYTVGDVISATLTGGTGFTATVTSVA
jgi:hypothetical protein